MNSSIKPQVVIDSNVLISAVVWGGKPELMIKKWKEDLFLLLISPLILAELTTFLEEHGIGSEEIEKIVDPFKKRTTRIIPPEKVHICRDEKDNQILDLCLAGKAEYLITGDKNLLILKNFKSTKILTPDDFLKLKLNKKNER